MSQVSPYARSTTERSRNLQTTTLFCGLAAALFFAALWLVEPSLIFSLSDPKEPHRQPSSTAHVDHETETTPDDEVAAVSWSKRIAAIEEELPDSGNAELPPLKQQLRAVARVLQGKRLSSADEASIQQKLNDLQQQAEMLNAQANPPNVEAEGFADSINSTAQSILIAEQKMIQQAREQADRNTRQRKEPAIREVRLEVRDNQDKATDLRRQIAQIQREQKELQAKAARAEVLRREMRDVKRYLQPFTAPGYLQPKNDSNAWDTERTADAKPVSLARLKRLGALENTMEGLERLYMFGGGKNPVHHNSRPLGSFPQYWAQKLNKPDVLSAVKRAQQLLRDHGQALVEEQLLSP